MEIMNRQAFLALEFVLLCIVLPTVIIVFKLAPYMLLFLWAAWAVCWSIYRHYHFAELQALWKWKAVTWENMKPIILRWLVCSLLMLAFTYYYDPERLFYIVKERPQLLLFLLFFYPIFSALPQEFIFCTFFFQRYKPFFKSRKARVWASAIVFAYAHVLFINPVAPVLSFIAGLIFASTFAKTKSLALVTIEHSMYGLVLFAVGLGWYFWGGALI
jgi:membrane protease YdiL (CAAX protease family)